MNQTIISSNNYIVKNSLTSSLYYHTTSHPHETQGSGHHHCFRTCERHRHPSATGRNLTISHCHPVWRVRYQLCASCIGCIICQRAVWLPPPKGKDYVFISVCLSVLFISSISQKTVMRIFIKFSWQVELGTEIAHGDGGGWGVRGTLFRFLCFHDGSSSLLTALWKNRRKDFHEIFSKSGTYSGCCDQPLESGIDFSILWIRDSL